MFFPDLSIFSRIRAIQLPKRWAAGDCILCAASHAGPVCARCEASLERIPPGAQGRVIATFSYRFPLDRLIQRYKYAGDLAIGRWLAHRLAERVAHEAPPDLVVVPPLSRARLRERGFNQALEIAKVVAHASRVRCDGHAVKRTHEGPAQAGLSRRARLANLRAAFRCEADVAGLDIVVVDDVVTTGATAAAMSRALRAAGAARVRVWAVARTPPPGH